MKSTVAWCKRRAFQMLILSTALSAPHLSAQQGKGLSPDGSASASGSLSDDLNTEARMSERAPSPIPRSARPVSADILRHPIKDKVRRMLRRALEAMNQGNHQSAIEQLKQTLDKYPESAAYVQSFLGVEYVKTQDFEDAVNSFEQATSLLPHDAMTHYNFGLSLACAGDYARAEQETRRALELDASIEDAHALMSVLEQRKASQ